MAFQTWAKLLGTTVGAAALAGASQLGLAYGLGILRLTRVVDVTARDQWTAQLAWVAWIAMMAAALGAIVGQTRLPRSAGAGTRILAAVAAGLGGAVVVPLTMQPARTAQVAGVSAVLVIGICAALAAVAGVFAAYAALSRTVARWSLLTVGAAIWVIAIVSVAPSLAPGDPLPAVRLGVLDPAVLDSSVTQRTALFTMPALALICGALLGWAARRRSMSITNIALAGLPGPALLTTAYLIAGPGSGPDRYAEVPYWAAMTATGAGVLGSVLIAVLRPGPASDRPAGRRPKGKPAEGAPTPDRPPLPRRDAQPESAIAQAAAAAARRPEHELRPSDTGVFSITEAPPFDGFAPPQARTPEPTPISAPLPNPQPVTPLPPLTPAPEPRGRGGRREKKEGEFVDWVSGLGNS
ncbi:MAG: hypothetical protein ABW022_19310 [Actinoplanes sp.]